ncbi:hypothetical protein JOQ06_003852, partial [Pogonophryne albipinna]
TRGAAATAIKLAFRVTALDNLKPVVRQWQRTSSLHTHVRRVGKEDGSEYRLQPWYYGWGFNLPRGQALLDKWNQIPDNTDILVTHCPPLGFLDWVPKKMQRVGCMELLNTVQRRVQPKFHVFGHIHEGYGMMTDGTTTFINASACTVNFMPMNAPIVFDLPNPRTST